MRKPHCALILLVAFSLLPIAAMAQRSEGRWSVSVLGGGNLWLNDLSVRKVGHAADIVVRYQMSTFFSLGILSGYREIKSLQDPMDMSLGYGYVKLRGVPLVFMGYLHMLPKRVIDPYVYLGAGALLYQRLGYNETFFPDNKFRGTYYVPAGIGVEMFPCPSFSFSVETGIRALGDDAEQVTKSGPDAELVASAGFTFYLGSDDGDDDDEDGLSNGLERRYATDPENPDTDGDGLADGKEVRRFRSNPLKTDTDGDGLTDGDEASLYKTSPTRLDTDGDGVSDRDELLRYKTDPLRMDTDGEGLADGDELMRYKTDPLKVDTDGDGLSDYDEVKTYGSNPNVADTDGDGLTDGDEVRKYRTDPLLVDTDKDGANDAAELARGTSPVDPFNALGARAAVPGISSADAARGAAARAAAAGTTTGVAKPQRMENIEQVQRLQSGKTILLQGVHFHPGSSFLTEDSECILEKALAALIAQPEVAVDIVGHTDNVGDPGMNEELSLRRAWVVKNWLVQRGITASRLAVSGRGEREPVTTNATSEGRAGNRRIEFRVN